MCELQYALPRDGAAREQLVGLGYLKSYEGMGRVRVECARGCSCRPVTLDGHHEARISPYDLHYMTVQTHSTTNTTATAAASVGVATAVVVAAAGAGAVGASASAVALTAPPSHCALRLTVLNQTSSEAHKFKLTALFLNRESDKAFFGGWIFRKAMDSKEKDMGKGDGWGASFRKVAGDRERRGRSRKASAKGGARLRKVAKAKGERAGAVRRVG